MTIADMIYQQVQTMPNDLAQEVLDFTEYLKKKSEAQQTTPTQTQSTSLFKLLEQCPTGSRTSEDIDRQLQTLRDEWQENHAIS